MEEVKPFLYRMAQLGSHVLPGAHVSFMLGAGQLFMRHDTLLANADPRRMDLRASVLNPFQELQFKVYRQPGKLTLVVIADLSRSMAISDPGDKQGALADFIASAANSAYQAGDDFSLISCGDEVETRWLSLNRAGMGAGLMLSESVRSATLRGKAESLNDVRSYLPKKRALVFLVSDFHFPEIRIKQILGNLTGHTVVPVVFWDESRYAGLPDWGVWKARDLETGATRTFLLRPGLKRKIFAAFKRRQQLLQQLCRSHAAEPLFIDGAYNADAVTEYFYGRAV